VLGQARSLKITGTVDYAALMADPYKRGVSPLFFSIHRTQTPVEPLIRNSLPQFVKRQNTNGLFVTEAKWEGVTLAQQVAHAVAEMYASAKYLKYDPVFLPILFVHF
jgi:hypothetical protein